MLAISAVTRQRSLIEPSDGVSDHIGLQSEALRRVPSDIKGPPATL